MTVAPATTQTVYPLAGVNLGPFATVFAYEQASDVEVWLTTTGAPLLLALGIGYTLVGATPLVAGGQVTLDASLAIGGWPANANVTLKRATSDGQPSSFGEALGFSPKGSEDALDHVMRQLQDLKTKVAAALGAGVGAVLDVNGAVGHVVLTPATLGAAAEHHSHDLADLPQTVAALAGKADLTGAAFAGAVTGLTAAPGDNTLKFATTAFVTAALAAIGAGVALATAGSPAALGVADRGVSTFAARADHVHLLPTLTTLGAAAIDLSNVTGANMRAAMLANGAILLANGVSEIALPAAARANKVLSFDGAGHPVFTDPAAGGGGGVTSVNGNVGVVSVTPLNIAAVAIASLPTLDFYGALNGNNVADNVGTINAAYAAVAQGARIWVPGKGSDTYYTSNTTSQMLRRQFGSAKFRTASGDNLPADFRNIQVAPVKGTGADVLYDMSGDHQWSEVTYQLVAKAARRSPDERYFDVTVTPRWIRQDFRSGGSGSEAYVNGGGAAIGAHVAPIDLSYAGTLEFTAGDLVAILSGIDGTELYRGVINAVTNAGAASSLDFTGAGNFAVTIPAGSVVTHSKRTTATNYYGEIIHTGKGDASVYYARLTVAGNVGTGMSHIFQNKTGGLYSGDIAIGADGVYATPIEFIVDHGAYNSSSIGFVYSVTRNQDDIPTGRGAVVGGMRFDFSSGSKPVDFAWMAAGKMRSGLDLVQGDFSSNGNCAIQLAQSHRIYFDSGTQAYPGRAADPRGVIAALWGGNLLGSTHQSLRPNNELDARGKRMEFVVNGNLSGAGYGAFNIRGSAIEAHRDVNIYDGAGNQKINLSPSTQSINLVDGNVGLVRIVDDLHFKTGGVSRLHIGSAGFIQAPGAIESDLQFQVANVKVVGPQAAAVAHATGAGDVVAQLNALIDRLSAGAGGHGLIA